MPPPVLPDVIIPFLSSDTLLQLELKSFSPTNDDCTLEPLSIKHHGFFERWRDAYLQETGNPSAPLSFDALLQSNSYYLLSHVDEYVGYLELRLQTQEISLIAEIWTPPHARGRGWSSRMVKSCLHMLQLRKGKTVYMMTANSVALSVYEKVGARIVK